MVLKGIFSANSSINQLAIGLLILRLALGCLMLTHGYPKLINLIAGEYTNFPDPLGVGNYFSMLLVVFAEVICSLLLIAGLTTRLAAIPLAITMIVAVFIIHAGDGLAKQELPSLYLAGYLTLLLTGAGKFSLDYLISKKLK